MTPTQVVTQLEQAQALSRAGDTRAAAVALGCLCVPLLEGGPLVPRAVIVREKLGEGRAVEAVEDLATLIEIARIQAGEL